MNFSEAASNEPVSAFSNTPDVSDQNVIFSICSRNYLPYAQTLVSSLQEHVPGALILLILADRGDVAAIEDFVGVPVIRAEDLRIPTYYDMAMRYNVTEFNTSIKPYVFRWLFDGGASSAIYIDPDIQIFRPLTEVYSALNEEGANAVVTPHITQPLDMDKKPSELRILQTGVYNLGFLALAASETSSAFVDWWLSFMPADCRADLRAGIFVDQKYVDLLPSYVPETKILRHAGYNVAYWNLAHRPLRKEDLGWTAGGEPLVFMHFSGIRPYEERVVSAHQDRLSYDDLGEGQQLFAQYKERLKKGYRRLEECKISKDYAYGCFSDGVVIEGPIRKLYAKAVPPRSASYEEAFDPDLAHYSAPAADVRHEQRALISNVMYDVWRRKGHLRKTFDLNKPAEAEAFALWFAKAGYEEWKISKRHIPKDVWLLSKRRQSRRFKMGEVYFVLARWIKSVSFLFPKSVRRWGVRFNRAVLPRIAGR